MLLVRLSSCATLEILQWKALTPDRIFLVSGIFQHRSAGMFVSKLAFFHQEIFLAGIGIFVLFVCFFFHHQHQKHNNDNCNYQQRPTKDQPAWIGGVVIQTITKSPRFSREVIFYLHPKHQHIKTRDWSPTAPLLRGISPRCTSFNQLIPFDIQEAYRKYITQEVVDN